MIDAIVFFLRLLAELSILYLAVTALVEVLRRRLPPERIQSLIGARNPLRGMLAAAALGAVTPFCSCSTVPLVAAMMRAGVPFPSVATFLVISPLANPAAFALLATLVSPLYAALYLLATFAIALAVGGLALLRPESATVRSVAVGATVAAAASRGRWASDLGQGVRAAGASYAKLAPVFALAAAVGALLHNHAAGDWMQAALSGTGWWMVPLAAVVGVPIYASTAFLLPLGTMLYANGVNLGVVTAFLMGATGFSVPEGILLNRLLGPRRLVLLAGAFTGGVVLVGYLFQGLSWLH